MAFQVLGDRRWCEGAEVTSEDMIGQIARYVRHKCEISSGGVRVAIDGCGAAGKTTLADRLSEALQGEVGEVLRALASTVGATPKSCGSSGAARVQRLLSRRF